MVRFISNLASDIRHRGDATLSCKARKIKELFEKTLRDQDVENRYRIVLEGDEEGSAKKEIEVKHLLAANEGHSSDEAASIKQQISAHSEDVKSMAPVVSVTADAMKGLSRSQKTSKIMTVYNKHFKGGVERQNFGFIELDGDLVQESLKYLHKDGEYAAFYAVPAAIKRGKLYKGHEDHKGNNFSTYTIIAPVEINGVRGILGVVIKKTGKYRYKPHRILMPDGSAFQYKEAESNSADVSVPKNGQGPAINSASSSSISQNDEKSTPNGEKNKKILPNGV